LRTFFADNTIQVAANNVLNTSTVAGNTVEQALDNLGGSVGSVFGENVSTATDESTTATASTTPVDKVTLTTTTLNAGIYYVAYNIQFFREGGGGGAIVSCSRARIILYRIR